MRIVYVGLDDGTSWARCEALMRLHHDVTFINHLSLVPSGRFWSKWLFHTGALGLGARVARGLIRRLSGPYDLAITDSAEFLGVDAVKALRQHAASVVNVNLDNPFARRDGYKWRLFLEAVPYYDMLFTPRQSSVEAALARGAREARRIWQAADDALRDPANRPDAAARAPFTSRVSFVGTWMPERGPFLAELIARGVPLRIIGPRWDRAPEYRRRRHHVTLGSLDTDRYHAAVAAADISVALLSKGNADVHTTRSLEIPALGSLLCGERTPDHMALYDEGREAFFWADAAECAATCLSLLADPARLAAAREAGFRRAVANGHFNEALMAGIVEAALA